MFHKKNVSHVGILVYCGAQIIHLEKSDFFHFHFFIFFYLFVAESWARTSWPKLRSSTGETPWCQTTGTIRPSSRYLTKSVPSCRCVMHWVFEDAHSDGQCLCFCRMMVTSSSTPGSLRGLQTHVAQMFTAWSCRMTATWSCTTRLTLPGGRQTPPKATVLAAVCSWPMRVNWWSARTVMRSGALLLLEAWNNSSQIHPTLKSSSREPQISLKCDLRTNKAIVYKSLMWFSVIVCSDIQTCFTSAFSWVQGKGFSF